MADPIRVIRDFHGCLASRAELALTDGMLWITFQFFRETHFGDAQLPLAYHLGVTLHNSHCETAARRAEGADAWFPNRDARDELIFWNKSYEVIFGISATGERGA